MVGPVFALELLRERRRGRWFRLMGWAYAGLLGLEILVAWLDTMGGGRVYEPRRLFLSYAKLHGLIAQHFALLFLITPALTATAFSEDKAKGILADLFTTALTSTEIVLGKLLGRSLRAVEVALYGLPVLCAAGAYVGLPPVFFAELLFVTLLVVLGVSAVGLVSAAMAKHASGAVLTTFLVLGAGALAVRWVPVPALDPFDTLDPYWGLADTEVLLRRLLTAALAWLGLAAACFGLAVWRLRPDGLRHITGGGRRRFAWAPDRPPVGDDPIRWKEYYIDGLAPLPVLRRVPRWVGVLAVCLAPLGGALLYNLLAGTRRASLLWPDPTLIVHQAVWFLVLAALIVVVRCAGAVTGERERQTFDSLRLAPLDGEALIRGKLRGILDAVLPYYGAYALVTLFTAFVYLVDYGVGVVVATGLGLLMAWPLMYYAAACGLASSAFARSTWRSLLTAFISVFVGGPLIFFVTGIGFAALFAFVCCAGARGGALPLIALGVPATWAVALVALGKLQLRQATARAFVIPREPMQTERVLPVLVPRVKGQRDA
jgi:ABC-type transport system involved in multi-copper enzyme maturation permease subunit